MLLTWPHLNPPCLASSLPVAHLASPKLPLLLTPPSLSRPSLLLTSPHLNLLCCWPRLTATLPASPQTSLLLTSPRLGPLCSSPHLNPPCCIPLHPCPLHVCPLPSRPPHTQLRYHLLPARPAPARPVGVCYKGLAARYGCPYPSRHGRGRIMCVGNALWSLAMLRASPSACCLHILPDSVWLKTR